MSGRLWWSAAELAAAELPDLPKTKRGINKLAATEGWCDQLEYARKRPGRGGGWEFHRDLLPTRAQMAMTKTEPSAAAPPPEPAPVCRSSLWAAFEALPERARRTAQDRLNVLTEVDRMVDAGATRQAAVAATALRIGKSERTIWRWLDQVSGHDAADWLPALAQQHKRLRPRRVDCSAQWWDHLLALYLRLEAPSFSECYRVSCQLAKAEGWHVLSERSAQRRVAEGVPFEARVLAREGVRGLERRFPPQVRDRSSLVAMEAVNADCHKIDVFVRWPDGTVNRPQIVAFQDLYSGKILSWRVDHDPNKVMVMAAFSAMVDDYGIPQRMLFDNGREFANKWMTGGAPTRFRFKIRPDEPLGVLPQLGIKMHWARPAHGQAKPVERAFRDLASDLAKDIRFAGAYVGHRPDAKPENYGSKAVDYELFLTVLDEKIAEHNARGGRSSPTCRGRSFDATFAESYATAGVSRATEEQRRLWLMGQEERVLARPHGRLKLFDNHYAAPWMAEHAGERIVARFDPEDLHAGVYLYTRTGDFLGHAPCQAKVGFFDATEAQQHHKALRDHKKAAKALLQAERKLGIGDVAHAVSGLSTTPAPRPEAKVVSAKFGLEKPKPAAPRVGPPPVVASERTAEEIEAQKHLVDFEQKRRAREADAAPETPISRFRRSLQLEELLADGRPITPEEQSWLTGYQANPEYDVQKAMLAQYGPQVMFGDGE